MKVLVVDDEKDMQALFEQRFRKEIRAQLAEFVFARSGEQALAFMEDHHHEVVLILSDINMPGMSGLELLRHIRDRFQSPPPYVIMITAYGDAHNNFQALRLGADDFFTKPLDFGLLKEKLKLQSS